MTTLAEGFLQQLAAWGVRRVFGLAGDAILPLLDALARQQVIRFVPVRHEETAAFMASAHAKLTGQIGVCLATSGPGAAHLINGLADAQLDRAPVLAITGQVPTYKLGTASKQYIDQHALFGSVTTFSTTLGSAREGLTVLARALREASAAGRVTHIGVPKDLWLETTQERVRGPEPFLSTAARSDANVVDEGARLIELAKRPIYLVGRGARHALPSILSLAERQGAAVIHSLPAVGFVPREHPSVVGGLGEGGSDAAHALLREADWIVRWGTTWWPSEFIPTSIRVLSVDATPANVASPSPVDFGVVGRADEVAERWLSLIPHRPDEGWRERVSDARREWISCLDRDAGDTTRPIPPAAAVRALSDAVPAKAIISLDVGDHVLWFDRLFAGKGQEVLVSGMWRSMGFGMPAALAAKLEAPSRPVVAMVGDGGLSMLLADFLTAVTEGIPIVVMVIHNGALAMEKNEMALKGLRPFGVDLSTPDLSTFAKWCGGWGERIVDSDVLHDALQRALRAEKPAILDVIVDDRPVPMVSATLTGSARSRPDSREPQLVP